MSKETVLTQIQSELGTETLVSDWIDVSQEMINGFADVTLDHQWIHTNPEKAATDSPYKTTIAHGFLTLSLIPFLSGSVNPNKPRYPDAKLSVNYGLNKVRFPNAVAVGSKIRARMSPQSVEEVANNGLQVVTKVTMEIDGVEKPACVAEMVARVYF